MTGPERGVPLASQVLEVQVVPLKGWRLALSAVKTFIMMATALDFDTRWPPRTLQVVDRESQTVVVPGGKNYSPVEAQLQLEAWQAELETSSVEEFLSVYGHGHSL